MINRQFDHLKMILVAADIVIHIIRFTGEILQAEMTAAVECLLMVIDEYDIIGLSREAA